jgi:hypothetical protein
MVDHVRTINLQGRVQMRRENRTKLALRAVLLTVYPAVLVCLRRSGDLYVRKIVWTVNEADRDGL